MHETLPENTVLEPIARDLLGGMMASPNWSSESVEAEPLLAWLLVAATTGMQRDNPYLSSYSRPRVALCWLSLFATLPEAWQGMVCDRISHLAVTPFDGAVLAR